MRTTLTVEPTLEVRLAQRRRPPRRPAMYQSWRELLFLHWRMDPEVIQAKLPTALTVDTFAGEAWVGVVPFLMRNIRPWWFPAVPGISNFQEINVRTYAVDEDGIPGVWFLSLDADTCFGCWWGRTFYRLPYAFARMSHEWDRKTAHRRYDCHRRGTDQQLASYFGYRPRGTLRTAEPGSLDDFLIERYVLFAEGRGSRISLGRVHHAPYEFCDAEADADAHHGLFELNGLPRPDGPAEHAVISPGVDVEVFALKSPD